MFVNQVIINPPSRQASENFKKKFTDENIKSNKNIIPTLPASYTPQIEKVSRVFTPMVEESVNTVPWTTEGTLTLKGLARSDQNEVIIKAASLDADLFMKFIYENVKYMEQKAALNLCFVCGRSGVSGVRKFLASGSLEQSLREKPIRRVGRIVAPRNRFPANSPSGAPRAAGQAPRKFFNPRSSD